MKIEDIHFDIPTERVDEENFDIKEWRKNMPMDYFKAIFLLQKLPLPEEVFKSIYKVARLYIPDVLFKYYSLTDDINLNEQKMDILQQKKIFMSDAKYLNDPFDSKAFYYNANELKKYEILQEYDGRLIDDFTDFTKLTSLTSNRISSMPMWAHYANNHMGFCVSYDMSENTTLRGCTFPVQYTDERVDITSLMDTQVQMILYEKEKQIAEGKREILLNDLSLIFVTILLNNIKHSSWSYENEFRCTMGFNAEGMPYTPAVPKEIFIGMKCTPTYEERIVKIAKKLKTPVYKMKFDELSSDYNLIPERIK